MPTPASILHHLRHHQARWQWLARLLLGLSIILLLARYQAPQAQRILRSVAWPGIAGAVLFYWALQTLSAFKWQYLLRALGVALPLRVCCRLYLIGMCWNLWMPTSIGGDAMRIYLVAPLCGGKAKAASSVLVERLTGFSALLIIGCAGLVLQSVAPSQAHSNRFGLRLICVASFAFALCMLALIAMRTLSHRFEQGASPPALWRKWTNLQRALDAYMQAEQRTTLILALALSLLFQAGLVILNIGLAAALGLQVPALLFWWLVPLLSLAALLPFGVGGLGVREAAAVALLNSTSATASAIVAWSLLWQATVWLASLPGVVGMWRAEAGAECDAKA